MMKPFSPANQLRVNVWKSNIDGIDKEADILTHHQKIYDWIEKRYTNLNTKKSHLSTLAVALRDIPEAKEAYQKYSTEATKLNDQVVETSKKQKIAPNRKYVEWWSIVKARDKLETKYENDRNDPQKNQAYLLACLYTMQPPVRQDYKDMKIVKGTARAPKSNFVRINGDDVIIHINNDKVIATHGPAKNKLPKELADIVIQSIDDFPRQYLLSKLDDINKPAGKAGFEKLMSFAFQPLKVSVDILRSSYITHVYSNKQTDLNEKERLAKLMRTSVATSEQQYNKPSYEKQAVTCPHCKKTFDI